MLNIYLTRHGETQWNKENRLQGWKDSKLTENGIKNAQLLGKRLANIPFNAIYTSPSGRAFQTAEYIASGREIPMITDAGLKEIYFGEWEGKDREEIEKNFKKEFTDFWNAPHRYNHRPHNGEGLNEFKKRVEEAFKRMINENASGNILIVTHAVVIRALRLYVMGISTEKMWEPPFIHGTSLSIFGWDGESFQVQMLGDTSHFV